ncbi:MAG: hypothetical protein VX589_03475 [Myxococcota bacterium]|nr:hypothetical protein [Myxococcota bacterium]
MPSRLRSTTASPKLWLILGITLGTWGCGFSNQPDPGADNSGGQRATARTTPPSTEIADPFNPSGSTPDSTDDSDFNGATGMPERPADGDGRANGEESGAPAPDEDETEPTSGMENQAGPSDPAPTTAGGGLAAPAPDADDGASSSAGEYGQANDVYAGANAGQDIDMTNQGGVPSGLSGGHMAGHSGDGDIVGGGAQAGGSATGGESNDGGAEATNAGGGIIGGSSDVGGQSDRTFGTGGGMPTGGVPMDFEQMGGSAHADAQHDLGGGLAVGGSVPGDGQ